MKQFFLFILGIFFAVAAFAQGPQWRHQFNSNVQPGQKAVLVLMPANTVYDVKLVLTEESSNKTVTFTEKKINRDQQKSFAFAVPNGVSTWKGELTGSADGATTTAPIELKVISQAPLDIQLSRDDVDLEHGKLIVTPNHPLAQVEAIGFDQNGQKVLEGLTLIENREDGKTVVDLSLPADTVLRVLKLKFIDDAGFWFTETIASWHVEIAHEEVVFESGHFDIRPEEREKLDRAVTEISKTLQNLRNELNRYEQALGERAGVEWRLFVAGYTDTVGQPQDNLVLSQKRAQSIATYLKKHGVSVPISYTGFGESALAVETPDNTDEIKNRRAIYMLSSGAPHGKDFPEARWTPLR